MNLRYVHGRARYGPDEAAKVQSGSSHLSRTYGPYYEVGATTGIDYFCDWKCAVEHTSLSDYLGDIDEGFYRPDPDNPDVASTVDIQTNITWPIDREIHCAGCEVILPTNEVLLRALQLQRRFFRLMDAQNIPPVISDEDGVRYATDEEWDRDPELDAEVDRVGRELDAFLSERQWLLRSGSGFPNAYSDEYQAIVDRTSQPIDRRDERLDASSRERQVRPWDAPVVDALDEIEKLPGFEPDHIEWDNFHFAGTGTSGLMERVFIYACPSTSGGSEFVRFVATSDGFAATDPERRELTASGVAQALSVPTESAKKAITALGTALQASLAEFNVADAWSINARLDQMRQEDGRTLARELALRLVEQLGSTEIEVNIDLADPPTDPERDLPF